MKNTKTILLFIGLVWFLFLGIIMLLGEPTEGGIFDSPFGFFMMKLGGMANLVIALAAWQAIPQSVRNKVKLLFH